MAASCATAPSFAANPSANNRQSNTVPATAWPGATAGLSPTPWSPTTCATRTLADMTEEQRVGQLFVLGISGDNLSAAETSAIETDHFGSVYLVNSRTGGVESVRTLTTAIDALATDSNTYRVAFFVAADQEGGRVQRLSGPGFSTIPSALVQGQIPTATLKADATTWGRELSAAGVNLDLGPVMDVVPSGADAINKPIGALQREYGHDPTTVGSHGAAVIEGMALGGIATTLKHFPGLGRVVGNTDTTVGVVDSSTTSDDPYLAAFRTGITAGAPFVMVSLATYSAIDPDRQAVFSPTIIGTLLRGQLGFRGAVVSDDLGAAAAVSSLAPGARATAFVAAGGDLILVGSAGPATDMAAAVLARARADTGFATQVDTAALRVLEAKATYGLLSCG